MQESKQKLRNEREESIQKLLKIEKKLNETEKHSMSGGLWTEGGDSSGDSNDGEPDTPERNKKNRLYMSTDMPYKKKKYRSSQGTADETFETDGREPLPNETSECFNRCRLQ